MKVRLCPFGFLKETEAGVPERAVGDPAHALSCRAHSADNQRFQFAV